MAVTNGSYVTDLTELWLLTEMRRFLELATDNPDDDPMVIPIPATTQDRIITALNWGWQTINNFLRNVYPVGLAKGLVATVSSTTPGSVVKLWNARLAQFALVRKRLSLVDEMRTWGEIRKELTALQVANAEEILGEVARSAQVLPAGTLIPKPSASEDRDSIFDSVQGAPWNFGDIKGRV